MKDGKKKKAKKYMEQFRKILQSEKGDEFPAKTEEMLERLKEEGFMEGYQYAIQVLKDGIRKGEEE